MVAELEKPLSLDGHLAGRLSDPREKKAYYIKMTPFRRVATPLILTAFRTLGDVQVSGAEKMPAEGPVVLAANHLTNFDVFPLQIAVNPRPIFYMGKEELFRNAVMDWALRQMGGFPVNRGGGDEWAVHHAAKVLQHGQVLGIFPEGSRSKGKGLKPAKTGAARLALDAGCPILPVALNGTQAVFKNFPHRTPVHITLGDPIWPSSSDTVIGLTDRLMSALAAMLPAHQRGVYHRS